MRRSLGAICRVAFIACALAMLSACDIAAPCGEGNNIELDAVSIHVVDDGTGVSIAPGTTVTVTHGDSTESFTFPQATSGVWSPQMREAGVYTVSATKAGYKPATTTVTVREKCGKPVPERVMMRLERLSP